jgi:mxaK protein
MAIRIKLMPVVLLLLCIAVLFLALQLREVVENNQYNQALKGDAFSTNASPDYVMINAWRFAKQTKYKEAKQLYAKVLTSTNPALFAEAHFNVANVYQKEAAELLTERGLGVWDKVTPLLAMAKAHYRSALRERPDWLDAKYNYELLLRLSPDIKSSVGKKDEENDEDKPYVKGWPSIPGFPRGMP